MRFVNAIAVRLIVPIAWRCVTFSHSVAMFSTATHDDNPQIGQLP